MRFVMFAMTLVISATATPMVWWGTCFRIEMNPKQISITWIAHDTFGRSILSLCNNVLGFTFPTFSRTYQRVHNVILFFLVFGVVLVGFVLVVVVWLGFVFLMMGLTVVWLLVNLIRGSD